MPYMYILECSDGSFYVGSTWDLDTRLFTHQSGLGGRYTKCRLPVRLVYFEECERIDEAYDRERQIHGWSRKKKLALIQGNEELLVKFAKNSIQTEEDKLKITSEP